MGRRFQAEHPDLRRRRRSASSWVGRKIASRRAQLRMTQKEVAGEVFTPAYISALERGLAAPSLASLIHLADALKVRPAYFLEGLEWVNR